STERLLVAAARLKDGTPVPAQVTVMARASGLGDRPWQQALASPASPAGACDANGLLMLPLTGARERVRVIASSEADGLAGVAAPLAPVASRGGDRLFLYTGRPIYRPGQTVHWRAFMRRGTATGYALPGAERATLRLTGPEGAELPVPSTTLSAHGSADGE